ncbi:MAG: class I SAM-dependent methyltransferase [Candidatus Omnitrophica bacterium]|nr:class I SAM-dependent methyltransferase [Candidatus Omnitrophota bacterium]
MLLIRFRHFIICALKKKNISDQIPEIICKVHRQGITYLSRQALFDLYQAVAETEKNHLPGLMIEAGCALGGSAVIMAAAKSPGRTLCLYDAFERIPEPGKKDGLDAHGRFRVIRNGWASGMSGKTYYGYRKDLQADVLTNFSYHGIRPEQHHIRLIKGLFSDTLSPDSPVCLAHIDADWYESTYVCLEKIYPNLVSGGRLIIDDYYTWSGCRRAVRDYFASKQNEVRFIRHSRLHIVRK